MGYFSKLVYADKFIVLDNVNYSARHYLERTQIINAQGQLMWIGLPIGEPLKKKINEIHFSDKSVIKKIIQNLYASYSKARFFKDNITHMETMLNDCLNNSDLLPQINIGIVLELMKLLELEIPEILFSSQFDEVNDATDRIIMLCKETQCDTLIIGSGGLDKHNWDKMSNNGINTYIQYYFEEHPAYYQTRRTQLGFAKGLSIIDCIFNEGIVYTKKLITDKKYKPVIYK
jgi:hypothetical protein